MNFKGITIRLEEDGSSEETNVRVRWNDGGETREVVLNLDVRGPALAVRAMWQNGDQVIEAIGQKESK